MKRIRPLLVSSFLAASLLPFSGPNEFAASAVTPTSFSFGASGDHAGNSNTSASLDALANSGTDFYLGLGDLSYGDMLPELAWCDYIKGKVGSAYPFEIVSGNHEDDGPDGLVSNFSPCLPDRLGNIVGEYSKEFYFDYPASSPLARMILISPNLTFPGETTYSYSKGSAHYQWVSNSIDAARTAGIPWVIVGMHKNCITAGGKSCEIGKDLLNLLVGKKVDLILQGHEHNYQRSKQLALNTTTCTAVPVAAFNASCIADDGGDGLYSKGAGSVIAIVGTFGRGGDVINPNDPEAPYFAQSMGGTANGFLRYQVSADQISGQFVYSAGVPFSDSFTIARTDSSTPSISINDVTVAEGNSATATALFNVSLSAPSTQTVSVNFATANNTASDPSDYLATSGTATFPPGTTTQVVPVVVNGDTENESNEGFFVNLSGATGANIVDSQGVATITNDDGPPVVTKTFTPSADTTILSTSPTTNYGALVKLEADNSPVQHFLMKFSAPELAGKTIVSAKLRLFCLDTSNKGGDFHRMSDVSWSEQTLNWSNAPPYEAATIASLGPATPNLWYELDLTSLVRDEALSGDGIFSLRANSTSSDGVDWASKEKNAVSAPQLVVSYTTDPTNPSISINDVTIAEGNAGTGTAAFNVSLSAPSTQTVSVNFATANNTASDPTDYLGTSGTATFPPGTTTQVVPVVVNGDTEIEPNENFFVNLSGAINGSIIDSQGMATITNDDGPPPVVTKTFTPSADTTILSTSPTTNYGALTKIEADNSPIQHFLIKFSAPELAGKTIVSAKLRLFCLDTSNKGGDFHRVSDISWSEQTLNWSNAPPYDAATIASLGPATPNLWYEVDLTSLVRDEALNGDGIFSLRTNSTSSDGVDWASKEKGATRAPQLVVTYS